MLGLKFPPAAEDRIPLTNELAVRYVLPVIVLYALTAYLVRTPGTRAIRFALLPITLSLSYYDAVTFMPSEGIPGRAWMDFGHCVTFFSIAMKVIDWTFTQKPLSRIDPNDTHSALWDTIDLCFNMRGLGWTWSKGLNIPKDSRDTTSGLKFWLETIPLMVSYFLAYDVLHYTVQLLGAGTFATPAGGTVFDPSVPQPWRFIYGSLIAFAAGLAICFALDAVYYATTLVVYPLVPQWREPKQWPALSNSTWRCESLSDFWGVRWHQSFRRPFIALGGIPFALVFGRRLAPLGAFFVSGIFHALCMWGMGGGVDIVRVTGFFMAIGVICVFEGVIKAVTGRKVSGWFGDIWAHFWVIATSHLLFDPWFIRGLAGSDVFPDWLRVGKKLIDLVLISLGY